MSNSLLYMPYFIIDNSSNNPSNENELIAYNQKVREYLEYRLKSYGILYTNTTPEDYHIPKDTRIFRANKSYSNYIENLDEDKLNYILHVKIHAEKKINIWGGEKKATLYYGDEKSKELADNIKKEIENVYIKEKDFTGIIPTTIEIEFNYCEVCDGYFKKIIETLINKWFEIYGITKERLTFYNENKKYYEHIERKINSLQTQIKELKKKQ